MLPHLWQASFLVKIMFLKMIKMPPVIIYNVYVYQAYFFGTKRLANGEWKDSSVVKAFRSHLQCQGIDL